MAKGLLVAVVFGCLAGGQLFAGTRESSGTVAPAVAGSDTSDTGQALHTESAAEAVEHGLPRGALTIASPLGFPVTNSMVVSWVVANILTDMAVAADKIDEAKAEEARRRAEARLRERLSDEELAMIDASLARALAQLRVKRRHRG